MDEWFKIDEIDKDTCIISEYKHWEETHCYLLNGSEKSLLIDTGLGISNIYEEVVKLTDKPVIVIATHIHWDHIGGHQYFSDFYAHIEELDWLIGNFPISLEAVKNMVMDHCDLPDDFDIEKYKIFQGVPSKVLNNNEIIDLGDRQIKILHTPGHSPGHLCFWEKEKGYLFTGDLVYKGMLYANYPSTNPKAYLNSLETILNLSSKRIFPAHHSLDIQPEIIKRMYTELKKLNEDEKLHHGSGKFHFNDWGIWL